MKMTCTNSYSCVLDSFAFVTQIPVSDLIEKLGHDGDPQGVSCEEMTTILLRMGWSVSSVLRKPEAFDSRNQTYRPIKVNGEDHESRWNSHLGDDDGVLFGKFIGSGKTHAVAWVDGRMVCPSGQSLDLYRPYKFAITRK